MKKNAKIIGIAICLLSLVAVSHCGGGSSTGETPTPETTSDYGAVLQDTGSFGAIMVDKNGESLLPMVERDADGNATGLTGATWTDSDGNSVTVYLDANGKPTKTVMGNYVLLFSNWSEDGTTVDIAKVYTTNNYIEVYKSVSVSANIAARSKSLMGAKSTCFPACDTDTKNLAELLKFAGLGISLGACGVATTVSLGAMALPCAGVIVTTASVLTSDETWLGNLDKTGNILTAIDFFKCGLADAESCVSLAIDVSSRTLDLADKVLSDNSTLTTTAETFLINPNQESAVIQEGTGLPTCTDSYQCNPNTYMPCYPEGVKQCSSSCTWGTCNHETCGDGTCDATYAGETSTSCPSDCQTVCGDGVCAAGEESSCSSDCQVNSCCVSTGNCPSEMPYDCPGSCCCCGSGSVCTANSVCS